MDWFGLFIGAISLAIGTTGFSCDNDRVLIETQSKLCDVSENFLSLAIDTHFIFKRDLKKLIDNFGFMSMLKSLKPAYLRIGGTAADLVTFDEKDGTMQVIDATRFSQMDMYSWENDNISCLKSKWDELHLSRRNWLLVNALAQEGGFNLIFDLNVLKRTPSGNWDPENAHSLIQFSQENNLTLDWQLGNEPNSFCHVFGQEVKPTQLAKDFETLSKILKKFQLYQSSKLIGPDITAPRGPKKRQLSTLHYLDQFLSQAKNTVSVATWHQYYISGRNATPEEFIDPSIMDVLRREIKNIKTVVSKNTDNHFPIWISETACAFGGGAPKLSNRFVSAFMWLDKLGMSALYNISVVIRQSFIGGHYGLIDEKSLEPNAAYWISYVYKKLVGTAVLKLETFCQNPAIRLYAHCSNETKKKSLVIFGLNVGLSDYKGLLVVNSSANFGKIFSMEKYILTGVNGNVLSRSVQLNGNLLKLSSTQEPPKLYPIQLQSKFIILPPRSMGFYVIKNLEESVCD